MLGVIGAEFGAEIQPSRHKGTPTHRQAQQGFSMNDYSLARHTGELFGTLLLCQKRWDFFDLDFVLIMLKTRNRCMFSWGELRSRLRTLYNTNFHPSVRTSLLETIIFWDDEPVHRSLLGYFGTSPSGQNGRPDKPKTLCYVHVARHIAPWAPSRVDMCALQIFIIIIIITIKSLCYDAALSTRLVIFMKILFILNVF